MRFRFQEVRPTCNARRKYQHLFLVFSLHQQGQLCIGNYLRMYSFPIHSQPMDWSQSTSIDQTPLSPYIKPKFSILCASLCQIGNELLNLSPWIHCPAWKQICVDPFKAGGISVPQTFHCNLIDRSILLPTADNRKLDSCTS